MRQKLCIWFFYLMLLRKVLNLLYFTTGPFAHTTHPNKIYSRLSPIMKSKIIPIFAILAYTWFLIMCQESISPPQKSFFIDSITTNKLIHIFFNFWGVVIHPYAFAQNWKYRWCATFVTSEIVKIFIVLSFTWFLIMCQDDIPLL